MRIKHWFYIALICGVTPSFAQREVQLAAYYAPQFGAFFTGYHLLDGTSDHPLFLGGKHGLSATFFLDRQHFGFETGIARSRTGGNLSQEYDGNGTAPIGEIDLYNQQFIYTKVPLLLTLNKNNGKILGFNMKIGFEYGRLGYAQNYYWYRQTNAFGYAQMNYDEVKINRFSRVKHENLVDYVRYFEGTEGYDLKSLYNKNHWSFLMEYGIRYEITHEFDLSVNGFLELGLTNIENVNAKVNGEYFWMKGDKYFNFDQADMPRTWTGLMNWGLKISLIYRLYNVFEAHGVEGPTVD